jgi:hypothetical protein
MQSSRPVRQPRTSPAHARVHPPCSERTSRAAQSSTTSGWACTASALTIAGSTPPSTACLPCAQRPALPAPGAVQWMAFPACFCSPALGCRACVPQAARQRRTDGLLCCAQDLNAAMMAHLRLSFNNEQASDERVRAVRCSPAAQAAASPAAFTHPRRAAFMQHTHARALQRMRLHVLGRSRCASMAQHASVRSQAPGVMRWARRCCRRTPQPSGVAC